MSVDVNYNNRKSAIITGANRGIGKAMVEAFATAGYDVFACARTKNAEFESFLSGLSVDTGSVIIPIYFDLANEEEIKQGFKTVVSYKKTIDVLINNAGIAHGGLMTMTSTDKLREVYQINVISPVLLMQLVSRIMMRQKSGCIINMFCRWYRDQPRLFGLWVKQSVVDLDYEVCFKGTW